MNLRPVFSLIIAISPLSLPAGNWQYLDIGGSVNRIEAVENLFVAVTTQNIVKTSSDGILWQRAADEVQPGNSHFRLDTSGLTYFEFETVEGVLMATISHTVDFESVSLLYATEVSEDTRWFRPLWDDDVQIALLHRGDEFLVLRSEGGLEWEEVFSSDSRQYVYSFITEDDDWILAYSNHYGPPGPFLQSNDKGLTWEEFNLFFGTFAILNDQYFGIQLPNVYKYSDDGINWFPHDIGFGLGPTTILSNGERIVLSTHHSGPMVSLDGFNYTTSELPPVPNDEFNYVKNAFYDGEYFWIRRYSLMVPHSSITQIVEYFRSPDGFDWEPADMPEQLPDVNQAIRIEETSMPTAVPTPSSEPQSAETEIHLGHLSIRLSYDSLTESWYLTEQSDGSQPKIVDANWGGSYTGSLSVEPVKIVNIGETIVGLNNRRNIGVRIPFANHLPQPVPLAINDTEGGRKIQWQAIANAHFYRIERTANPYSAMPLIQIVDEVTELFWQDDSTSLIAGRDYYYRVSAHSQDNRFSLASKWVRSLGSLKGITSESGMWVMILTQVSWEYEGGLPIQKTTPILLWTDQSIDNTGFVSTIPNPNTGFSWSDYHGWWYNAQNHQERHWQYDFLLGWLWVDPQNLPYIYNPAENAWMKYKSGAQANRIFSVIPEIGELSD